MNLVEFKCHWGLNKNTEESVFINPDAVRVVLPDPDNAAWCWVLLRDSHPEEQGLVVHTTASVFAQAIYSYGE